jgi:hypothetical protein
MIEKALLHVTASLAVQIWPNTGYGPHQAENLGQDHKQYGKRGNMPHDLGFTHTIQLTQDDLGRLQARTSCNSDVWVLCLYDNGALTQTSLHDICAELASCHGRQKILSRQVRTTCNSATGPVHCCTLQCCLQFCRRDKLYCWHFAANHAQLFALPGCCLRTPSCQHRLLPLAQPAQK